MTDAASPHLRLAGPEPAPRSPLWALPSPHVPRPRLWERLRPGRLLVVEAAGGYGKSTFAAELAHAHRGPVVVVQVDAADTPPDELVRLLRRSARRAGSSDLARSLPPDGDPDDAVDAIAALCASGAPTTLLVVDEAQRLAEGAAALVAQLADPMPRGLRLVVAGRATPDALQRSVDRGTADLVGPDDLRFTDEEISAFVELRTATRPSPRVVSSLRADTDGWAALVYLAASHPGGGLADGGRAAPPLEAHLDRTLADAPAALRGALTAVAHLDGVHADLDVALGVPGLLGATQAAGIPVTRRPDGWWDLARPVALAIRRRTTLAPDTADAVARRLAEIGRPLAAARLRLALGDVDEAVARLDDVSRSRAIEDDAAAIVALSMAVPPAAIEAHPRSGLVVSWAHFGLGHLNERRAWLTRARAVAEEGSALRREVDAEWAWVTSLDNDYEPAIALANEILADTSGAAREPAVRARALGALAVAVIRRDDPVGSSAAQAAAATARNAAEASARLWTDLGEPWEGAEVLLHLGYQHLFQEGRFDESIEVLQRGLALVPGRSQLRARLLVLLAEVHVETGALGEAAALLDEAHYSAASVGHQQTIDYCAWQRMVLASRADDAPSTTRWHREVTGAKADWLEGPPGVLFLTDSVTALARVDVEAAEDALARLLAHPQCIPVVEAVARAAVAGRRGDVAGVDAAVGEGAAIDDLPERLRWWVRDMQALACHHAGDLARRDLHLAAAHDEARLLGIDALPELLEPQAARAMAGGDAPRSTGQPSVGLLGGFTLVDADGTPVSLRSLDARRLVALVVVVGPCPLERTCATLWPDLPTAAAQRKLRNLLYRIGQACPGLVERRGTGVALGDDVRVDVWDFERALVRLAEVKADGGDVVGAARTALARYAGDLTGTDLDEDWLQRREELLRRRYLDLLDLLVAAAIDDEDPDEAIRLAERAIEADPGGEETYATVAGLLIDCGRLSAAGEVLDRAARARQRLDLPPSRVHHAMRARLDATVAGAWAAAGTVERSFG